MKTRLEEGGSKKLICYSDPPGWEGGGIPPFEGIVG